MADEVKPKTSKSKAEKTEEVEEVVPVTEEVSEPETVVEPEPEVVPEVKKSNKKTAAVEAEVESEEVEIMAKRGRKSKSTLIAQLGHELQVNLDNEPWLAHVHRAEYERKLQELK